MPRAKSPRAVCWGWMSFRRTDCRWHETLLFLFPVLPLLWRRWGQLRCFSRNPRFLLRCLRRCITLAS